MLVDKQNELMSNLLFTVHQHGGDNVTWKYVLLKLTKKRGFTNSYLHKVEDK